MCIAPEHLHRDGISDHGPLEVICMLPQDCKETQDASFRPIPKHFTKHPEFKRYLDDVVENVLEDNMSPETRLHNHKLCIHAAANHVRDINNLTNLEGSEERRLIFEAMARAIWTNNVSTATKLIARTTIGKEQLQISGGIVRAINPEEFENHYVFEQKISNMRENKILQQDLNLAKGISEKQK